MGIKFNPLIFSGFDQSGSGGGGSSFYKDPVANHAALPTIGNSDGDVRVTLDTHLIWVWDANTSSWQQEINVEKPKKAVAVASTDEINFDFPVDPSPIDGYTLQDGDRVLLKDQSNQLLNGIWIAVTAIDPTTWVRPDDFYNGLDVSDSYTTSTFGDSTKGTLYVCSARPAIVGVNNIFFIQHATLPVIPTFTVLGNKSGGNDFPTPQALGDLTETVSSVLLFSGNTNILVKGGAIPTTIEVQQSSGSLDGYLSSTDWNTFNNKANSNLNNLTSPTSINEDLIPSADNTKNLGSSTDRWAKTWTESVDADSAVLTLNGSSISANSKNITDVTNPNNPQDAATKVYVDNLVQGLNWKETTRSATTAVLPTYTYLSNVITETGNGALPAQDGVTLVNGDRLLVKDETLTNTPFNGIYVVTDVGSGSTPFILTRSDDANTAIKLQWATVEVGSDASTQAGYIYREANDITTLGTDDVDFALLSHGLEWVFNTALSTTGNVVDVKFDNSTIDTNGSNELEVKNSGVTNAKLANMTNNTVKANKSGGAAAPSDLSLSDVTETTSNILTITNGTKSIVSASDLTIEVQQSSSTLDGYLSSTDWNTFNNKANASTGDISQTSFSAANNQSSAADVTGLAFANGSVRSFDALVSIFINATSSLYAVYELKGIQKGSSWEMSQDFTGDATGITFSITNAGQVQYTSTNVSGFVSDTMKFRAIVTNV